MPRQIVARQVLESPQQADEVQSRQIVERPARRQAAALQQHYRRAPRRDVVAERPGAPGLVVARHAVGRERRQRLGDGAARAFRPQASRRQGVLGVAGDRQQRIVRQHAGVAHGAASILVVQVEAEHG